MTVAMPLLVLDERGQPGIDVAPAGIELLDLLEDGDRLGREAVLGELVGEGKEDGDRLLDLARGHQDVARAAAAAAGRCAG